MNKKEKILKTAKRENGCSMLDGTLVDLKEEFKKTLGVDENVLYFDGVSACLCHHSLYT